MNLSKRQIAHFVGSCSVLALLLGCSTDSAEPANVAAALAHPDRPVADAASDAQRKPAEVLAFAGLEAGMDVFELEAGGGYYTEILSHAVGPDGSVILQHPPGLMRYNEGGIESRTADNRLPNVRVSLTNFDALDAADNSIDMVTWIQGPHELGFAPGGESLGDPAGSFQEIARILKPGGVLLMGDHIAPDGAGLEAGGTLHRIEESVATDLAEAAGLKVLRTSDILRNSTDPLNKSVFDPEVQGKTSQFLVLYQK